MQPQPDLEAVEATLNALFNVATEMSVTEHEPLTDDTVINDEDEDVEDASKISTNYPDLVPRHVIIAQEKEKEIGNLSETLFLLAVFLGTCLLLYIFPPEYE